MERVINFLNRAINVLSRIVRMTVNALIWNFKMSKPLYTKKVVAQHKTNLLTVTKCQPYRLVKLDCLTLVVHDAFAQHHWVFVIIILKISFYVFYKSSLVKVHGYIFTVIDCLVVL